MSKKSLSKQEKDELETKALKENERLIGIIVVIGIIGYLIFFAIPTINPDIAISLYMIMILGVFTYWWNRMDMYREFIEIPTLWFAGGVFFTFGFIAGLGGVFTENWWYNYQLILILIILVGCGWSVIFDLVNRFYPKFFALSENYHISDAD